MAIHCRAAKNSLRGTIHFFIFILVLHYQMQNFFIEPPPDAQRKERQGERGMWVAMSCYLSHATPPLPPPPHTAHLSHRLRPRNQD